MTISVNSKKKQVKKSFEELLTDLKTSNSEKVRYNAARVLGEMGDSKAVEPLIDVLKHDKTAPLDFMQPALSVNSEIQKLQYI